MKPEPFFSFARLDDLLEKENMAAMVLCRESSYGYFTGIPWRDRTYFPECRELVALPIAGYIRGRPEESFAAVARTDLADVKMYGTWVPDLREDADLRPFQGFAEAVASILKEKNIESGRVGLELAKLPHGLVAPLELIAPKIEWVECEGALARLQEFKSEREVRRLRKAAQIAEQGMMQVLDRLEAGITPRQLMNVFMGSTAHVCSERYGHFNAVMFGSHHLKKEPWQEVMLCPKTVLHIDVCTTWKGLISDIGRNFYFGRNVPPEVEKISHGCNRAVDVLYEKLRPGIPYAEVNRLKRDTFLDLVGEPKTPASGIGMHGLGWVLYSHPTFGRDLEGKLLPGHTFTIEVVAHYPGLGHFKCEDMFVMRDEGPEKLNSLERKLFVKRY